MIERLLEKGADINYRHDGKTAFEYLFAKLWSSRRVGFLFSETDSKRVCKVIQAFLERGQDANIDVHVTRKHRKRNYICKPLHAAPGVAIQALLQHGAHVNALDRDGLTPLDNLIHDAEESSFASQVRVTASLLLEHGGCITHSTRKRLPNFISTVSEGGSLEVPDSFRNPPQLKTVAQRIRNILPSYLGGT
jgi:hypothetical protein